MFLAWNLLICVLIGQVNNQCLDKASPELPCLLCISSYFDSTLVFTNISTQNNFADTLTLKPRFLNFYSEKQFCFWLELHGCSIGCSEFFHFKHMHLQLLTIVNNCQHFTISICSLVSICPPLNWSATKKSVPIGVWMVRGDFSSDTKAVE